MGGEGLNAFYWCQFFALDSFVVKTQKLLSMHGGFLTNAMQHHRETISNFMPSINKYILEEWQTSWNNSIGNKLLDIKPTIGEYQSVVRNIRREEVVLARLRLGHTRVTHSYLLQGEEQPQCVGCDAPFTVRHFLLECGDFAQVRNNCFHVDNMKELFQDIHIDSIMTFLRQINLFNKI